MPLQDLGGKAPFEALLIYATPLAPDRTRVARSPVYCCSAVMRTTRSNALLDMAA